MSVSQIKMEEFRVKIQESTLGDAVAEVSPTAVSLKVTDGVAQASRCGKAFISMAKSVFLLIKDNPNAL